MNERVILVVAALLATTLPPSELHADSVPPPPKDCPAGSIGLTGHCGEWCEATECKTDADCRRLSSHNRGEPRPLSCREAALCVEHDDYDSCSGWSKGKPLQRIIARNPCQTDGDCIRPARCEKARRCFFASAAATAATPSTTRAPAPAAEPGTSPNDGSSKDRCACSLPGTVSDSTSPWWLLLGLAALWLRRSPTR